MEFNLEKNNEEEDSKHNHKQKIESMSFDLLKSELELTKVIATKEVDKYKRKCHNLEELVCRLQQDLKISREREMKDRETINNLLIELETNEKDYTKKLVELQMKIFDLERVNETIKNLHSLKKSSFTEVGELPLPSQIAVNTPIIEASTSQKGRIDSLEKKRMFKTLDSTSTSATGNANNITAHCAETTVQKEGPKDSTELSKSSSEPKKRSKTSNSGCTLSSKNPNFTSSSKVSTENVQLLCSGIKGSGREYKGRLASSEQIASALKRAKMLQSSLKSDNPSFIKPMLPSNVSGGFWLSVPSKFAKENLCTADRELNMVLEDEDGLEYKLKYLSGPMRGLSGGWRGFAITHNLEIGDALVFELNEPARFKVHIIKAIQWQSSIESGQMTIMIDNLLDSC